MSEQIQVTVRGWAGGNAEKVVTSSGAEYARFRLAATRGFWDRTAQEYRTAPTEWFTVKAWGARASNVLASVGKGVPLVVRGHLQLDRWTTDDGEDRAENALTASLVAVDLDHGEARFTKVVRERRTDESGSEGSEPGQSSNPWDLGPDTDAETADRESDNASTEPPF